jgi:hypothetical protein
MKTLIMAFSALLAVLVVWDGIEVVLITFNVVHKDLLQAKLDWIIMLLITIFWFNGKGVTK